MQPVAEIDALLAGVPLPVLLIGPDERVLAANAAGPGLVCGGAGGGRAGASVRGPPGFGRSFDLTAGRIDGPFQVALALTLSPGLTVVYSASGGASFDRVLGQARNIAVAAAALWIIANIPPQALMRLAVPVYAAGLVLLVGVALFGDVRNGARRWLNLGFTTIQPSEVMKIAVPLVLAWYFHRHQEAIELKDYAVAAVPPEGRPCWPPPCGVLSSKIGLTPWTA